VPLPLLDVEALDRFARLGAGHDGGLG
jgi:hypothetical protein